MALLDEVPGAVERPSGCRITVAQSDDGRETVITIPPRDAPLWLLVIAGVLAINLLLILVTGAVLFIAHRSILFMTQIAPRDLPLPMRRFEPWFALGWASLLGLGVAALLVIVRPLFLRETITIGPHGVRQVRSVWGRSETREIAMDNLRGFHLERDPQKLVASVLSIRGRGEELPVAEYVGEADREWLASVGNALLRRL